MQATIVDLRYQMKKVLAALKRNEEVTVLYRGQEIAILTPIHEPKKISVEDHPFFGMCKDDHDTVKDEMKKLRSERYRDI